MIQRQKAFDDSQKSAYEEFKELVFGPDTHLKQAFETCSSGIERLKSGPMSREDFDSEVEKGRDWEWINYKYNDYSFSGILGAESSYWWLF